MNTIYYYHSEAFRVWFTIIVANGPLFSESSLISNILTHCPNKYCSACQKECSHLGFPKYISISKYLKPK